MRNEQLWVRRRLPFKSRGAVDVDQRCRSIWNVFPEMKGRVVDEQSGAHACDHYRRMAEDGRLMRELEWNAYRAQRAACVRLPGLRHRDPRAGHDVETGALEALPELPKPPAAGRKLPSAFSTEEVEAMLGKPRDGCGSRLRSRPWLGFGMDVDLKTGAINVRRALSENARVAPKSGHERVVPLFPGLAAALADGIRDKLPAAPVVLNQSGRTPSRQAVWTELHALLIRHQLPARSYQALRHYFLTALVRGGANLEAVRELAGHSKLHTTQRYVHATGADLRDAIGQLPGN